MAFPSLDCDIDLVTLNEGDRGSNVQHFQMRLASLDLYKGAMTGYFDAATREALEAFQRQYELEECGYFGTETWYALTFWSQETALPSPGELVRRFRGLLRNRRQAFHLHWKG